MEDMANPTGKHAPKSRRHGQGTVIERLDRSRLQRWEWRGSYTDEYGRRHRPSVFASSEKAALAAGAREMKKVAAARGDGASLASLDTTVADFLEAWMVEQRQTLRPSSWSRYAGVVKLRLVPTLGREKLHELDVDDVRRARGSWGSPKVVGDTLRVLRAALNDAKAEGKVTRNVASLVEPPRVEARKQPTVGPDEIRAVFAAFEGDWMYPIVVTAALCGLRRGEVLGLRRRDLDFTAETLSIAGQVRHIPLSFRADDDVPYQLVAPKTPKSRRTIGLPPTAAIVLLDHLALVDVHQARTKIRPKDDLVFYDAAGGPINPNRVTKRFDVLMARAKLPHIRFHDLRHGQATLLALAGVGTRTAMDVLGHTNEGQTHRYTGVLPSQLRAAADGVEQLIEGGRRG